MKAGSFLTSSSALHCVLMTTDSPSNTSNCYRAALTVSSKPHNYSKVYVFKIQYTITVFLPYYNGYFECTDKIKPE